MIDCGLVQLRGSLLCAEANTGDVAIESVISISISSSSSSSSPSSLRSSEDIWDRAGGAWGCTRGVDSELFAAFRSTMHFSR